MSSDCPGSDLGTLILCAWLHEVSIALSAHPGPARNRRRSDFCGSRVIAAADFFTVPTITFEILYVFFVVHHGRRALLHFNVTAHPTSDWIIRQILEAFPWCTAPRYFLLDRDSRFTPAVLSTIRKIGTKVVRLSFRSPWQNGVAERWVLSVRRDLLDHVVVLGEGHLRRLLKDYVWYYTVDRTHLGLGKDTPDGRSVTPRPSGDAEVVALPRVGGLHYRYEWRTAA